MVWFWKFHRNSTELLLLLWFDVKVVFCSLFDSIKWWNLKLNWFLYRLLYICSEYRPNGIQINSKHRKGTIFLCYFVIWLTQNSILNRWSSFRQWIKDNKTYQNTIEFQSILIEPFDISQYFLLSTSKRFYSSEVVFFSSVQLL